LAEITSAKLSINPHSRPARARVSTSVAATGVMSPKRHAGDASPWAWITIPPRYCAPGIDSRLCVSISSLPTPLIFRL
jgi:hypothetical protein